jgi:hypothetical protein
MENGFDHSVGLLGLGQGYTPQNCPWAPRTTIHGPGRHPGGTCWVGGVSDTEEVRQLRVAIEIET